MSVDSFILALRGRDTFPSSISRRKGSLLLFGFWILLCQPLHSLAAARNPVRGLHGMVASAEPFATQVGVDILKRGGNAIDAAVGVGFALAVTYPAAGNLGGGGFMLIRKTDGSDPMSIDFRETAPQAAHRDLYLDEKGQPNPKASTEGWRAAGVPGSVAGMLLALEKYGTWSRQDILAPAIELAEKGFIVSHALAESLRFHKDFLGPFSESYRIFLRAGRFYRVGELFQQPELARSLRLIADQGAAAFYQGVIANQIVAEMAAHGGLITREDLMQYHPVLRKPIQGTFKDWEIFSMGPPSSGGIALLEMLNLLEPFQLTQYGPNSSQSLHLMVESMRRVFADRAEFLGDSDFVKVPVARLIDKNYADRLRRAIDPLLATKSEKVLPALPVAKESKETTHYSIADKQGNAVAVTTTINGSFGCGVTVKGAGFLLNNEMDDFAAKPGTPNMYQVLQGEANAISPGKRPLSSMTPVIVVKGGRNFLIMGSPGGPTIINTVFQVVFNVLEFGMNIQEAIDAPRIHHQWMPDVVQMEKYGFSMDTRQALQAKGHRLAMVDRLGDAQGIVIDPSSGVFWGATDPRYTGLAAGY